MNIAAGIRWLLHLYHPAHEHCDIRLDANGVACLTHHQRLHDTPTERRTA